MGSVGKPGATDSNQMVSAHLMLRMTMYRKQPCKLGVSCIFMMAAFSMLLVVMEVLVLVFMVLLVSTLHFDFSGFLVGCCINEEKVICYQIELGK